MATYAAAKAFVLHFSEALNVDLKGRGVQVTAVCPGPTATSFFEGVSTTMKGRVRQRRTRGPPHFAVVRSGEVRRLSRTV